MIGIMWIPESPEYLYQYYRFEDCKKSMLQIAKFNKVENIPKYKFDVEEELRKIQFDILTGGKDLE